MATGELLFRPLVGRFLSNGDMNGDEYLKKFNVVKTDGNKRIISEGLNALEFYEFTLLDSTSVEQSNSTLIDKSGAINIVVQYEIEYRFGALPLPFSPTLKVTRQVKTQAWLDGNGEGYDWDK